MARAFAFRFETLLRLRRQREDNHKRVVAARLREIHTLEERQHLLESRIVQQSDAIRGELTAAALDVDTVRLGRHWLSYLRRGVLELQSQLMSQKALLAHERAELVKSRKDAEVLSRLRERQSQVYYTALDRREQVELDELNIMRASRNRK